MNILYDNKKIDKKIFDETNEFLEKNKYVSLSEAASPAKVFFFHYLKSQFEMDIMQFIFGNPCGHIFSFKERKSKLNACD